MRVNLLSELRPPRHDPARLATGPLLRNLSSCPLLLRRRFTWPLDPAVVTSPTHRSVTAWAASDGAHGGGPSIPAMTMSWTLHPPVDWPRIAWSTPLTPSLSRDPVECHFS